MLRIMAFLCAFCNAALTRERQWSRQTFLWDFPVGNLWDLWERYCQDFKCPVVFHYIGVTELVLQQQPVMPQGKDCGPVNGAG